MGRTRKRTAAHSIPSEDGFDHGDGCVVVGKRPRSKPAHHDSPQGTIGYRSCAQLLVDARSRLDGQTPALRAANPTRKQHRGVEPDRCAVSTSSRTSKCQLLYSISSRARLPRCTLFPPFYRRATWSVGRPGAAFSTPMSVALRRRFPRRRPPCPCCKFTSSTAISQQLNNNCVPNSRRAPPRGPSSWSFTLVQSCQPVFEHRLSAGTRVTSHHGFLHDFHHQLLHPAPLMNSPSSSTCSHLLLVTSSHLDFPGGVMTRRLA